MKFILRLLLLVLFLFPIFVFGQKKNTYVLNDLQAYNPAGISLVDKFNLNLKAFSTSIFNDYYNGYISFNAPFNKINSNIAIDAEFYNFNEVSDLKYSLSYSYKFQFSENIFLAIGAGISRYNVKDKLDFTYLHDSSYYYSSNNYKTITKDIQSNIFNLDVGIWFQNNNLGIGIIYNHINNPKHKIDTTGWDIAPNVHYSNFDRVTKNFIEYLPEFNLIFNYKFEITNNFKMDNSIFIYDMGNISDRIELTMNNVFTTNNTFIFGTAWEYYADTEKSVSFGSVIGFHLKNKYKLMIAHYLFSHKSNIVQDYEVSEYNPGFNSKRNKSKFECSFQISF